MKRFMLFSLAVYLLAILQRAAAQDSSCGGLYESDGGRISTKNNGATRSCIWIIKSVSQRNLNLNLESLDDNSVLFVYTQEAAKQRAITPIRLTSTEVGSILNVKGQSVTLILPANQENSRQISLSWTSSSDTKDDQSTLSSANYGQSSEGEADWLDFGVNQVTTWALNGVQGQSLNLVIDTQFGACDLDDPCLCSNFGLYEVAASGLLREVGRVCGRPLHIEATRVSNQLVAFFNVNPESPRKQTQGSLAKDSVSLKWSIYQDSVATTTESPGPKYKNCLEIQQSVQNSPDFTNLESLSPVQKIYPQGPSGPAFTVICDFITDGGGWTLIQNRGPGPREEFYLGWDDYEAGFGDASESGNGNYWIGLQNMYQLSSSEVEGNKEQTIRFQLTDWEDVTVYAQYTNFYVQSMYHSYRLNLGSYSGTAGNSMVPHDGCPFTTKDRDNDYSSDNNCGELLHSGFWFSSCYNVNLNGYYWNATETMSGYGNGIVWYHFHGASYSLKYSEMKIRDSDFRPTA